MNLDKIAEVVNNRLLGIPQHETYTTLQVLEIAVPLIRGACEWTYHSKYKEWESACDYISPGKNHDYTFCPFCGGEIDEVA